MSGLDKCYAAFERLKANTPTVASYKNINTASITASIVSKEAGLDAGYLKRSRAAHQPLISLIDAYKNNTEHKEVKKRELKKLQDDKSVAEINSEKLKAQLELALGRELILVRQLKQLEAEKNELLQQLNVIGIRR